MVFYSIKYQIILLKLFAKLCVLTRLKIKPFKNISGRGLLVYQPIYWPDIRSFITLFPRLAPLCAGAGRGARQECGLLFVLDASAQVGRPRPAIAAHCYWGAMLEFPQVYINLKNRFNLKLTILNL